MLKTFDSLSPPITLYYKNQDRHSSSLSGFLTIIAYAIIIILSIFFSLDFLLKMHPSAYFYNKFVSDTGLFPSTTPIFLIWPALHASFLK